MRTSFWPLVVIVPAVLVAATAREASACAAHRAACEQVMAPLPGTTVAAGGRFLPAPPLAEGTTPELWRGDTKVPATFKRIAAGALPDVAVLETEAPLAPGSYRMSGFQVCGGNHALSTFDVKEAPLPASLGRLSVAKAFHPRISDTPGECTGPDYAEVAVRVTLDVDPGAEPYLPLLSLERDVSDSVRDTSQTIPSPQGIGDGKQQLLSTMHVNCEKTTERKHYRFAVSANVLGTSSRIAAAPIEFDVDCEAERDAAEGCNAAPSHERAGEASVLFGLVALAGAIRRRYSKTP